MFKVGDIVRIADSNTPIARWMRERNIADDALVVREIDWTGRGDGPLYVFEDLPWCPFGATGDAMCYAGGPW